MRKWLVILKYALRRGGVLIWAVPLALISGGLTVLQPWPMRILVDNVLASAPWPPILARSFHALSLDTTSQTLLKVVAIVSLGLFITTRLTGALLTWISIKGSWETVYSLAEDVFKQLQRRAMTFHKKTSVGELMNEVLGDTRCAQQLLENLLFGPFVAFVTITGMLLLMLKISVILTILAFAAFPVSWAISALASRRLRAAARLNREIQGQIQAQVQRVLAGISVVQAFGREAHEENQFRNLAEHHIRSQKNNLLLGSIKQFATGWVSVLTSGLVLWLIARDVLAGRVSLGGALMFLAYFGTLQAQLGILRNLSSSVHEVAESIGRVVQILDTPPEIIDKPDAERLPKIRGQVEFRHVTAGYDGNAVLRDVSFKVDPGQSVAVIGPTGSGKTSLVNLILRLEDPLAGQVLIDGHDIRNVELGSLRGQIALVMQEPFLSAVSIAENIACGNPCATSTQIEEAAQAAQAHEFITSLPEGYDTIIGERGTTLSGGMRQRISIARALLKDAPILILDEPSSSLDGKTEKLMIEALEPYMKERTTFIVAHRLSTIRNANIIITLNEGRILENGTPAELRESKGYYAKMQNAFEDLTRGVTIPT
jgi:ATP-binding cassette subfamily B protein/subfamily B ATP-binding cassette protein MsbA